MPIKDNVTCKICKLLPNQRRPGPTPHSHLHSPALRPSQLPWWSHGAQAVRPLGTLGLREMASPKPPRSAEVGGDSEGPFCPLLLCTPFAPGPWVSRVAAARPGGGNVPGQILALLSQVSHPRGSVLMSLNPGSLFSAPGNSHTGADTLCPRSLGSSSSVTTDQLLETV